jgi:hypothetical protein
MIGRGQKTAGFDPNQGGAQRRKLSFGAKAATVRKGVSRFGGEAAGERACAQNGKWPRLGAGMAECRPTGISTAFSRRPR